MTKLQRQVYQFLGDRRENEAVVKIAVLDTGIDISHPCIRQFQEDGRIPGTRSFIRSLNGDRDTYGHGTQVADILLSVAPNAEIYARVFEINHFTPSSSQAVADVRRVCVIMRFLTNAILGCHNRNECMAC
jgi:hypothetical protein